PCAAWTTRSPGSSERAPGAGGPGRPGSAWSACRMGSMSQAPPRVLRGRVVTPTAVVDDGVVAYAGDRITWVGAAGGAPGELREAVTAAPRTDGYVLPGLVVLHCHGGGGASTPDAEAADTVRTAVAEHLRHGTTSL